MQHQFWTYLDLKEMKKYLCLFILSNLTELFSNRLLTAL